MAMRAARRHGPDRIDATEVADVLQSFLLPSESDLIP